MIKVKLILTVLINCILLNIYAQNTIVIQPNSVNSKDAFINQLHPTTNFGSHEDFISYCWTFSGDSGNGKSLIQFDLSAIPANSIITSAALSLFYNYTTMAGGQAGNNACYLKRVTSFWDENTVTWNTVPSTDTTGQVYLAMSTASNQDYPNIDITNLVQGWCDNQSTNYGLMLELIDQSLYNSMKFCSSDVSDPLKRPKLVITYAVASDSCVIIQQSSEQGKDAFINQLQPTTNFGSHQDFISYYWSFSGISGSGKSLIQFDLSAIPSNSLITSAALNLYYNFTTTAGGQAGNNACYLKKVTSFWDENTVTWNTVPSADTVGKVYLATSTASNQDYPGIDITNFVQGWYANPATNHGLMLELIDQSLYNSMKFCSSDNPNVNSSPRLIICYQKISDIENTYSNKGLIIYPNPVKDRLVIETGQLINESSLTIFNLSGQELIKQELKTSKTQIDLSKLPNGIYFVKFITDNKVEVKMVIKT